MHALLDGLQDVGVGGPCDCRPGGIGLHVGGGPPGSSGASRGHQPSPPVSRCQSWGGGGSPPCHCGASAGGPLGGSFALRASLSPVADWRSRLPLLLRLHLLSRPRTSSDPNSSGGCASCGGLCSGLCACPCSCGGRGPRSCLGSHCVLSLNGSRPLGGCSLPAASSALSVTVVVARPPSHGPWVAVSSLCLVVQQILLKTPTACRSS